jgi:hypothetical protein
MSQIPPQIRFPEGGKIWLDDLFDFIGNVFRKGSEKRPDNQPHKITIEFWEKIDPEALIDSFTVVAHDNNVLLHITEIQVDDSGKKLKIFVDVSGTTKKDRLEKEISREYAVETQKREDNGTINYIFIETLIQNHQNLYGSSSSYTNVKEILMSESYQSKYDQRNANNQFVDTTQSGSNVTFNQQNYTPEQKQNLAEAAAEIQQLLYQLAQTNPTSTEAFTEAIHQEVKRNPTLKVRLQGALKAGGLEALKAIFNHPLFSIPAETVKGWLEAE